MIVTKIEPCTKTKFKIYIDETFKFVLYKGEVSRFGIRIGKKSRGNRRKDPNGSAFEEGEA